MELNLNAKVEVRGELEKSEVNVDGDRME